MKTRALAQGGVLTGVSVVLLYLASFMQIASWSVTMIVGFIPAVFFLRGLDTVGTVQYLATSLIALFILPDKSIAILYALFFGLFTVMKFWLERRFGRILVWAAKILFSEAWVVAVWKLVELGLVPELPALTPAVRVVSLLVGALVILYYNFCLGRIFAGLNVFLKRIKF